MGREPGETFKTAALELHPEHPSGTVYGRIYDASHANPLGYGKSPSRFSDPRAIAPDERFGVLYLGSTIDVCFLEAVLRDQRDGQYGDLPIEESELDRKVYATIRVREPLSLVDLRGNSLIRMGVPTDVPRSSEQDLARRWSLAFHDHPAKPDGIIYPSRLNGETNIAVYDRAIGKLEPVSTMPLKPAPGLARVLDEFQIALV